MALKELMCHGDFPLQCRPSALTSTLDPHPLVLSLVPTPYPTLPSRSPTRYLTLWGSMSPSRTTHVQSESYAVNELQHEYTRLFLGVVVGISFNS